MSLLDHFLMVGVFCVICSDSRVFYFMLYWCYFLLSFGHLVFLAKVGSRGVLVWVGVWGAGSPV